MKTDTKYQPTHRRVMPDFIGQDPSSTATCPVRPYDVGDCYSYFCRKHNPEDYPVVAKHVRTQVEL